MEKILNKVTCPSHYVPLIFRYTKITGYKVCTIRVQVYVCLECEFKVEINDRK